MRTPLEQLCFEVAVSIEQWYEQEAKKRPYMARRYDQLARSATSVGANFAESKYASSSNDYVNKLRIAMKEASESVYWIEHFTASYHMDIGFAKEQSTKLFSIIRMMKKCIDKAIAKTNDTPGQEEHETNEADELELDL